MSVDLADARFADDVYVREAVRLLDAERHVAVAVVGAGEIRNCFEGHALQSRALARG